MKLRQKFLIISAAMIALGGCTTAGHHGTERQAAQLSANAAQESEILALFDQWNASLATGNPAEVAANYAPDAVLLPTVSNRVRLTDEERIDYFEHFLALQPVGNLDHSNVRVFDDVAINSGIYTFRFSDGSSAQARYTFVYKQQTDGRWLITEHHSSLMPEKVL